MEDKLVSMKECLMAAAQNQMGNLENVNAKELGEVVDMIKDLAEASYYCTVTKTMEDREKEQKEQEKIDDAVLMSSMRAQPYSGSNYYTPYMKYIDPYLYGGERYYDGDGNARGMRDSNNPNGGRMYYGGSSGSGAYSGSYNSGNGGRYGYYDAAPMYRRDYREGVSPNSRRSYMESRELHQDKKVQMQELEKYIQELGQDITEMIRDSSPEEKNLLQQKLSSLATKIGQ